MAEYAQRRPRSGHKRIVLRFDTCRSKSSERRVERLRVTNAAGGATTTIDCGLILRSIGYRGRPLPGLPFDDVSGTVTNNAGRVVNPILDDR